MYFKNLFSPVKIGNLYLKNRIVLAPMALGYADDQGRVSERQIDYYRERAKGGVGLIISESNYILPESRGGVHRLGLYKDEMINEHRKLVEAIHQEDVPICAQLHHAGGIANPKSTGYYPVAPSSINYFSIGESLVGMVPRKLTILEIKGIIESYGKAAVRAREAGYDAVMIHGAHGYLMYQFLSPRFNQRTDEYGGSDEGRVKYMLDIVREIRRRLGLNFPILSRLTAEERSCGGFTIEYTKWIAKKLEEEGVNEVSISAGNYDEIDLLAQSPSFPQGGLADFAHQLKKNVGIVVGVAGKIKDPQVAENIIKEGKADVVYMGRALIADPWLPQKAKNGLLDDIRGCITCNRGCFQRMLDGLDVQCSINPQTGREKEYILANKGNKKRVVVVGGGPGGMEAARVAAECGHQVTLLEQRNCLGGQLKTASKAPYKGDIEKFVCWLEKQIEKLPVEVKLNIKASVEDIEAYQPDLLILATGAEPLIPDLPGSELSHVYTSDSVLNGKVEVGDNVVIIGGGLVGLETAEFLIDKGKKVTVIEILDRVLQGVEVITKKALLERISDKGVKIMVGAKVINITSKKVLVEVINERRLLPADNVILAVGRKSNNHLLRKIDEEKLNCISIGDCVVPRKIHEAVHEGFQAGLKVNQLCEK